MLIHHLSSTDAFEGAARGAYRVHTGLKSAGIDSRFLVARKSGLNADVTQVNCLRTNCGWVRWLDRRFDRFKCRSFRAGPRANTFWSLPQTAYRPADFSKLDSPSLYHLHWVANFLDWRTLLPWLARRAPIVWTFRDLNPLLGIWHYDPNENERTSGRDQLENRSRLFKKRVLDQIPTNRLSIIASSRWMEDRIRASELFGRFKIRRIPHGLEIDIFRPMDKVAARAALGISSPSLITIGFVAGDVADPRKGLNQLTQALEKVRSFMPIRLFSVGGSHPSNFHKDDLHFGQIQNDRLLTLFYNSLDLFVCPSLQEAFGQTVFEAMSCGTPVVGFNTGGIPDMVRPSVTGWLADVGDVQSLAASIQDALNDQHELLRTGSRCRQIVESEFRLDIQAQAYQRYYEEVLAAQK